MGEDVIANNEKEWLDFKAKEEKTITGNGGDPTSHQEAIQKELIEIRSSIKQ